ncbi:NADP-reducing hydrogenase subunit HndA [Oxobacter pfennigii]|uniref:NADP-reducing hydrogenase subunit HndA n=1 Tax=Oxobacter pfennigii TaxID=36849 RepID=A0A0P8Z1P6_9CLOT|nr:NADH-quinone oxidoreductase subunit NuoE [Oxobacter pfennigii]KPU46007.1 NADP-reducing hydrogenase subunit HndA [Oxobacter pfennigii]
MANSISSKFDRACIILDKYDRSPSKLIPILQDIQAEYKYLPEEIMTFISVALDISPSTVYGVATFYAHFTLEPKGKHVIKICDGTACHVKKSEGILNALEKDLGLNKNNKTTKDMMFTLETVACLGACGLAPAVVVDEKVHGLMTPEKTLALLDSIKKEELDNVQ